MDLAVSPSVLSLINSLPFLITIYSLGDSSYQDISEYSQPRRYNIVRRHYSSRFHLAHGNAYSINCFFQRLVRESRVWHRLDHPNIQPYLGHCADLGPSMALISPYWKQGCVRIYLQRHPDTNKGIRMKIASKFTSELHINIYTPF